MLVRGTRRLASGLALALVFITLYMVYYGPYVESTPRPPRPPQPGHVNPGDTGKKGSTLPPAPAPPSIPEKPEEIPSVPPGSGTAPGAPQIPVENKPDTPVQHPTIIDPPPRNPAGIPPIDVPVEKAPAEKEKTSSSEAAKPTNGFVRKKKGAEGLTVEGISRGCSQARR